MRVLLDIRKLGDGGIGVYIENLVDGLLELKEYRGENIALTLLVEAHLLSQFNALNGKPVESPDNGVLAAKLAALLRWASAVQLVGETAGKYSFSEYFLLALRKKDIFRKHDVFHIPHYTLPFFVNIPSIVTIHDAIHVTRPECVLHKVLGRLLICSAMRRATGVITVSKTSKKELKALCNQGSFFKGDEVKINVIPNAFRGAAKSSIDRSELERRFQLFSARPYYLFVGSDRPHKGFYELCAAWRILKNFYAETCPGLVVVGKRFSKQSILAAQTGELSERDVCFLADLTHEDLQALYRFAKGVVVPSLEEGFGLVALDALGHGRPLVCSPAPSLREVCADAAWYSSDFSPSSLADVLKLLENSPSEAERRVELGLERVKQYSLLQNAKALMDLYINCTENQARQ